MHLSMASYLGQHFRWPRWDSDDLLRYYGTSYATSSSLSYWIEGLLLRLTGQPRWSPRLLLCVYLAVLTIVASSRPILGLVGLSAVTPQVLFVFSYVNADAWIIVVALLFGIAVERFRQHPTDTYRIVLLLTGAAACLTCRPHMWAIGFIALLVAFGPRLVLVLKSNPRAVVVGLVPALLVAAWWPATSYVANDGDVFGRETAHRSRSKYAVLDQPRLGLDWAEVGANEFATRTAKSFYGWWGWGTISLPQGYYWAALALGLPIFAFLLMRRTAYGISCLLLLCANFALMVLAARYHGAIWQGRYLFPAFFVVVGIFLGDAREETTPRPLAAMAGRGLGRFRNWLGDGWALSLSQPGGGASRVLAAWLTAFILLNGYSAWALRSMTESAQQKVAKLSGFDHAIALVNSGMRAEAINALQDIVQANSQDRRSLHLLGYLLMRENRLAAAQKMLCRAMSLSQGDAYVKLSLGEAYFREGQAEKALALFYDVFIENPRSLKKPNDLAPIFTRTAEWGAVADHCRRALQMDAENSLAAGVLEFLNRWRQRRESRWGVRW